MFGAIEHLGRRTGGAIAGFGDFCRFCGQTLLWTVQGMFRWRNLRRLFPQMYEIGTRSIPVVMITGAFVGMVLAVQTISQFRSLGLTAYMGTVINLSVLRELGPVLTGVMLAGRVGGGLTAELGTMRVTEQIDALRAMGADPIRVLVVPRFVACTLMIPLLVIYANVMGMLGGYVISVHIYGASPTMFWRHSIQVATYFDVFYGLIKSVFFGAAISLIGCHRGFRCAPGASGVGRACTQGFVASCMTVLALNFLLGMLLNRIEQALGLFRTLL